MLVHGQFKFARIEFRDHLPSPDSVSQVDEQFLNCSFNQTADRHLFVGIQCAHGLDGSLQFAPSHFGCLND